MPGRTLALRARFLFVLSIAMLPFAASALRAQSLPAAEGAQVAVFGTANAASLGLRKAKALGFSAGGYMQSPGLLGVEVRGSIYRWYTNYSQYIATGGVRASVRQKHFSEYAFVGGGVSHARFFVPPSRNLHSGWGGAVELAGGVDLGRPDSHFSWRVVDVSYTHIILKQSLNNVAGSTGILFHF